MRFIETSRERCAQTQRCLKVSAMWCARGGRRPPGSLTSGDCSAARRDGLDLSSVRPGEIAYYYESVKVSFTTMERFFLLPPAVVARFFVFFSSYSFRVPALRRTTAAYNM